MRCFFWLQDLQPAVGWLGRVVGSGYAGYVLRGSVFNQSLLEWDVGQLVTCRGIVRGLGLTESALMWGVERLESSLEAYAFKGQSEYRYC